MLMMCKKEWEMMSSTDKTNYIRELLRSSGQVLDLCEDAPEVGTMNEGLFVGALIALEAVLT